MKLIKKKGVILILSTNSDQSTSDVIEYLISWDEEVLRFNYEDGIEIKTVSIDENLIDIVFISNKKEISINSVKSFWYRKGELISNKIVFDNIREDLKWYLKEEQNAVLDYLIHMLNSKSRINYINDGGLNKLIQLKSALKCKLKIPDTFLTNECNKARIFLNKHKSVITKSIQAPLGLYDEQSSYSLMTNLFTLNDLKKSTNTFFITKFQNQVHKLFELRIFYLKNVFYSMAIFSQNDEQTKVDFRNYNYEKPNRRVPFTLPIHIEIKLKRLMKELSLMSGSIDMIVDNNNEFYFLEVNPVGQYGMVSHPCNYYLDEKIANILRK